MRLRGGEGTEESDSGPITGSTEEGTTTTTTTTTKRKMKATMDNLPFGHICDDIVVDNNTSYIRIYCQNVCGIFDREGIALDSAFKEINSFQAIAPYMGQKKGVLFYGGVSPSKIGLIAPY
jgi:hypothetical protein